MRRPRVIRRLAVYALGAALLAFLVLNVMAYFHVWSMLHFAGQRERTRPPERLGWAEKVKVILVGIELPRPANWRTPADVGLDFTSHRFSIADGMELEAWWIARPVPRGVVLLFHGYGPPSRISSTRRGLFTPSASRPFSSITGVTAARPGTGPPSATTRRRMSSRRWTTIGSSARSGIGSDPWACRHSRPRSCSRFGVVSRWASRRSDTVPSTTRARSRYRC